MTFKIGIISDTHGLLRPEAVRRLSGVDHIIHGGDIGRPEIVAELRDIAPVTAIRGNVDKGDWARVQVADNVGDPRDHLVRSASDHTRSRERLNRIGGRRPQTAS